MLKSLSFFCCKFVPLKKKMNYFNNLQRYSGGTKEVRMTRVREKIFVKRLHITRGYQRIKYGLQVSSECQTCGNYMQFFMRAPANTVSKRILNKKHMEFCECSFTYNFDYKYAGI